MTVETPGNPDAEQGGAHSLAGGAARTTEGGGLIDRLSAMFERADSAGRVLSERDLREAMTGSTSDAPSNCPSRNIGDDDLSIPTSVRLMQATEGLSCESLSLLVQAFEHLTRSEKGKTARP